jgi:DNA invertase Pin-like site-specific DNA recombinase
MAKRVAIYVRVSTDGQSTDNQRQELEAMALRSGWHVVRVFVDHGVSGAKGREQRPAFDALCKAVARREVDLVAAWAVDRVGRSLRDLVEFFEELRAKGVGLYLHQQGLDTTTPAGRAMFGMTAVFAEFERAMIVERVRAGLKRAKRKGRVGGRPPVAASIESEVLRGLEAGTGKRKLAAQLGIGTSVVQRIARRRRQAEAA